MTTKDVRSLAQAINRARPEVDESDRRIIRTIYRLLSRGRPVADADIAASTGSGATEIASRTAKWPGLYRDDSGAVIGFWGLTIAEMPPHELILEDRTLWAWCAWDALFLPRRIGAALDVRSRCPVTGTAIALRVSPTAIESVDPQEVVVSFLKPTRPFDADLVGSFCHFVHFFAGVDAGSKWISERPGTFLMTLEDAFEVGRLTDYDLFDRAPQP